MKRNKLSNATHARNLARTAIASSTREVSANRIANKSKEQGYSSGRKKREIEALREAMGKFGLDKGTVVTLSEEDEEPVPEGVIEIVPAWKWFLRHD